MTAPVSTAARERELDLVAREWAGVVSTASYIPLAHKEIERRLRGLAHEVFDTVASEPFDAPRAAAVGERLVELHCVGHASLAASVDVLAGALLADGQASGDGALAERVARTIGAVAAGYANTVRRFTAEQQDGLNRALLEVMRQTEERLRARELECDEVATELSLLRSQLNHQLLHDVVTGLANRQYFTTRLEERLNMGSPASVYHVEITGLATIRAGLDRQVHAQLVRLLADRLTGVVRGTPAMVAHLDDGRFGILVESTRPAPDPAPLVAALNAALAEPAYVAGRAFFVAASTGVVQSPPHGTDPGALLHAADLALCKAKRLGPGRFAVLPATGDDPECQDLSLAATLPDAWWSGRVDLEFRPRVGLADGRRVGLDALLRWDRLGHERCLSLADRVGFGPRLGGWLLAAAAERLRSWPGDLPVSVSLPRTQATDPDLVSAVERADLPAERLLVSVPAGTAGRAAANLAALTAAGVAVGVHDFGGTAGDVTCLADAPVTVVRLAPALVARSGEPIARRALRDMIALAHEAGATVVVDGVDTEADARRWHDEGADVATGPAFGLAVDLSAPGGG